MHRFLLFSTVVSVVLASWALSLWFDSRRVCLSVPVVAGFEFIRDDGSIEQLERCSPLSYLFQPSFDSSELEAIRVGIDQVTKAQLVSDRLGIPIENRFKLYVGSKDLDLMPMRLMSFVLAEASTQESNQYNLAGAFYGLYIQLQYFSKTPEWLIEQFQHALLAKDQVRQNSVVLMQHFLQMKNSERLRFLKSAWKTRDLMSLVAPQFIRSERRRMGQFYAVVVVKTETDYLADYFLAEVANGLSSIKQTVVVQANKVLALFPRDEDFHSSAPIFGANHLILLQCEAPDSDSYESFNHQSVYFIKFCDSQPVADVSGVAERVVSYLRDKKQMSFIEGARGVSFL